MLREPIYLHDTTSLSYTHLTSTDNVFRSRPSERECSASLFGIP